MSKVNKKRLLIAGIISLSLTIVYAIYPSYFETFAKCLNCDFYTYRNDWLYKADNANPHWSGSGSYPDGYLTFEELVRKFYILFSVKILVVFITLSVVIYLTTGFISKKRARERG